MPLDPAVKRVVAPVRAPLAPPRALPDTTRAVVPRAPRGVPAEPFAAEAVGELPPTEEGVVRKVQKKIGMVPKAAVGVASDILDTLRIGEFITAGIAEEIQRSGNDEDRMGILNSIRDNIKERRGYSEFTGNVVLDLGMSILMDPLTYVPGAAFVKAARVARVGKGLKKVSEATDAVKSMRQIKEMVGRAFKPGYMMGKYHPELAAKRGKEAAINAIHGAALRHGEDMEKLAKQLAPDPKRQQEILDFAETVHTDQLARASEIREAMASRRAAEQVLKRAGKGEKKVAATALKGAKEKVKRLQGELAEQLGRGAPSKIIGGPQFATRYAQLTKDEKQLFRTFRQVLAEREQALIYAERLERERAAKFLVKHGINYVPHRMLTKNQSIARLKAVLASLEAGEDTFKGMDPEAIKLALKRYEEVNEISSDAAREMMYQWNRNPRSAPWRAIKKRQVGGTIDDIARLNLYEINQDLAAIMGVAKVEAMQLTAGRDYINSLVEFSKGKGFLFHKDALADPLAMTKALTTRHGKTEATRLLREGFRPIKGVKDLKDFWAPRAIAGDIEETFTLLNNPRALEEFFVHFAKVQNWWKAWTLSVFPSYHARNHISNMWNNFLAGLGRSPKDLGFYEAGRKIVHHGMRDGKFGEGIVQAGKTQKELWNLMRDYRVVRAGETTGEIGRTVAQKTDPHNWVNPLNWVRATNPVVRGGFRFGQYVEDTDRAAHFLWRLSKGDTLDEAARSVQKHLFDYTFGLTSFEKKWLRNFAMPFWAWTRFNLPLQLEMLATQPAKFTGVRKGMMAIENQFGGPKPEDIYMAQWLQSAEKIRIHYNEKTKEYEYFMLNSWWPAADLRLAFSHHELGEQALNMVSPFLKMAPELLANYSLFTKKKITEYPGQKKKLLKVPLAPRLEHLLRQFRLANEVDRVLQAYDRQAWAEVIFRPTFGKVYPQNYEKQKQWWIYYQRRQLGELKRQRTLAEKRGDPAEVDKLNQLIKTQQTYIKEWD